MNIVSTIKRKKMTQFTILLLFFILLCYTNIETIIGTNLSLIESKSDFPDQILLSNGVFQEGIFYNESSSHNWRINDLLNGQIVYVTITPESPISFSKLDLSVNLYTLPSELSYNSEFQEYLGSNSFLGSWKAIGGGDWIIQVNDTRSIRTENASYQIKIFAPDSGFDEVSARWIGESYISRNFSVRHEVHYWKVRLKENQNGTLFLKEITSTVLFGATMTIFPQGIPNNPILPSTEIQGSFNFSWNAFIGTTYIIKISHKIQDIFLLGGYNISFITGEDIYSFDTAKKIPFNSTILIRESLTFIFPKKYYFWFQVNSSRSIVNIRVLEIEAIVSSILNYADVEIFDAGLQEPIYSENEQSQKNNGEFNITMTLNEGRYYLVVSPRPSVVGVFSIHFEYQPAKGFIWNPFAIFLNIVILIIIPISLIYLDEKGKWRQIREWTIPLSIKEAYKLFKYSFSGVFNFDEVPNESILIRIASIPFKTYAFLNFVESSENETLVVTKRIKRKIEWIVYLLLGVVVFDILNILSFLFFSIHFLPIYFSSVTNLLLVLVVPTVFLSIIVLFVNLSTYITYNQVVYRISYVVENYKELSSSDTTNSVQEIDEEKTIKSINYVRVLWNQAKHAFKDKNYELFVIKADAAVKNLLTARFIQLQGKNMDEKPDFQIQVTELRNRGFDLPKDKKIVHYRNLRNRIVHSSVTLDEKESVDCYAYYSAFISRLGLRPN